MVCVCVSGAPVGHKRMRVSLPTKTRIAPQSSSRQLVPALHHALPAAPYPPDPPHADRRLPHLPARPRSFHARPTVSHLPTNQTRRRQVHPSRPHAGSTSPVAVATRPPRCRGCRLRPKPMLPAPPSRAQQWATGYSGQRRSSLRALVRMKKRRPLSKRRVQKRRGRRWAAFVAWQWRGFGSHLARGIRLKPIWRRGVGSDPIWRSGAGSDPPKPHRGCCGCSPSAARICRGR